MPEITEQIDQVTRWISMEVVREMTQENYART